MNRLLPLLCLTLLAGTNASAEPNVLLGAHVGSQHDPRSKEKFEAFEKAIGRKLTIDNDHEDWALFPDVDRVKWNRANGRRSMLSWRIVFQRSDPSKGCATADEITSGKYDDQLRKQAEQVKALGGPSILVRYNYEMSNNQENTCFTGFKVKTNLPLAGTKYIAAWKHVVDVFRKVGANNIEWVFAPGHNAYISGEWKQFYPGNDYVDWIGIDNYNKTNDARSFATDPGMLAFYAATSGMGKPLMVAETGAVSDPKKNPDPQTLWLQTAREFLKTHPQIKAFLWWQNAGKLKKEDRSYEGSGYELQGSGLEAFKAMANDPSFVAK